MCTRVGRDSVQSSLKHGSRWFPRGGGNQRSPPPRPGGSRLHARTRLLLHPAGGSGGTRDQCRSRHRGGSADAVRGRAAAGGDRAHPGAGRPGRIRSRAHRRGGPGPRRGRRDHLAAVRAHGPRGGTRPVPARFAGGRYGGDLRRRRGQPRGGGARRPGGRGHCRAGSPGAVRGGHRRPAQGTPGPAADHLGRAGRPGHPGRRALLGTAGVRVRRGRGHHAVRLSAADPATRPAPGQRHQSQRHHHNGTTHNGTSHNGTNGHGGRNGHARGPAPVGHAADRHRYRSPACRGSYRTGHGRTSSGRTC